jgi:hypothetical protein
MLKSDEEVYNLNDKFFLHFGFDAAKLRPQTLFLLT